MCSYKPCRKCKCLTVKQLCKRACRYEIMGAHVAWFCLKVKSGHLPLINSNTSSLAASLSYTESISCLRFATSYSPSSPGLCLPSIDLPWFMSQVIQNWWKLLANIQRQKCQHLWDCSAGPSMAIFAYHSFTWWWGSTENKPKYDLIIKLSLREEGANRKLKSFPHFCHVAFTKVKAEQAEVSNYNINRNVLKKTPNINPRFAIRNIPARC